MNKNSFLWWEHCLQETKPPSSLLKQNNKCIEYGAFHGMQYQKVQNIVWIQNEMKQRNSKLLSIPLLPVFSHFCTSEICVILLFISVYWLSFLSFFLTLKIFLISWRLITLQYCSGFCHTLTWISHWLVLQIRFLNCWK